MSENHEHEGFGVIQLGDVTSYGQWRSLDGNIELSFDTRSLSLDRQRDLENYRQSSVPIPVQIPSDRRPVKGVVIGFQRDDRNAKFYVTRHSPSQKPRQNDGADSP